MESIYEQIMSLGPKSFPGVKALKCVSQEICSGYDFKQHQAALSLRFQKSLYPNSLFLDLKTLDTPTVRRPMLSTC